MPWLGVPVMRAFFFSLVGEGKDCLGLCLRFSWLRFASSAWGEWWSVGEWMMVGMMGMGLPRSFLARVYFL